jgi:hypothetical protein
MPFTLPSPATIERHEIDVDHMHEVLANWKRLPLRHERAAAQRAEYKRTDRLVTGATAYCLMADDSVALCYFGGRGGFRMLYNFGKGRH